MKILKNTLILNLFIYKKKKVKKATWKHFI